jgi:hypothetical protein
MYVLGAGVCVPCCLFICRFIHAFMCVWCMHLAAMSGNLLHISLDNIHAMVIMYLVSLDHARTWQAANKEG